MFTYCAHFNRDWDLWGPLMLCLLLGIMLSINVRVSLLRFPCYYFFIPSSLSTSCFSVLLLCVLSLRAFFPASTFTLLLRVY